MENTPTTTTGVNLPAPVVQMRETLPSLLEKNIPWMEKKNIQANELLDSIPDEIQSDEEAEDVTAKLAGVRSVGTALSERRMEMTRITDAFKDVLMEYERPFDSKSDKSKYSKKKKVLENYQQKKLEERRRLEIEAAKRKELDNLKVDLKSKILQQLSDNVVETVKKADDYARNLFATLEVDNFDTHAEQFKKQKPKLKQDTYSKCFEPPAELHDKTKQLFGTPEAFDMFLTELQKEETYDKWNATIQEAVAPVLNEWRAKIPDLKAECIAKSKASEEEKQRIEVNRKKRDEEESAKRKAELDKIAEEQKQQIQSDANLDKMSNSFAEQSALDNMAEAGKVKLVLKFKDPKEIPKALFAIMYHVLSHPDYPGIQRRDAKTKKLMFDEKQRPIYVEEVQKWIDFFLSNCNADVPNTQIFEDAKVVVRK